MTEIFTAAEIEVLSAEIDRQLHELKESRQMEIINRSMRFKGGYRDKESFQDKESFRRDEPNTQELIKQKESIESLTKEPMPSFLLKFGRAAKSVICDKDGVLNKQWQKWGDLENKESLERLGGVLTSMGFSGHDVLPPLTVAVIVVIGHIGLKAFCEDYGKNT
jgi:hypothetical protein